MITTDTREYRSFPVSDPEKKEYGEEGMVIDGRAIVFDDPTVLFEQDGVQYKEKIDPHALDGCDLSDVILNVNHEGQALARTRNKTLELNITDKTTDVVADLSKSQASRDAFEAVKNGLLDRMSFSFVVAEGGDDYDEITHTRTIRRIAKLYDVSLVNFPAYEATSASARNYFSAKAEAERKATEVAEREAEASRKREERRASLSERLTKLGEH